MVWLIDNKNNLMLKRQLSLEQNNEEYFYGIRIINQNLIR